MYILTAGTQLGRFKLIHLLGKGGMGEVWKGDDPRLGRDVAIKILPPELEKDPDLRARFARESKILGALNHPYIAHIYEAGEEIPQNAATPMASSQPVSFLVMELIDGKSISEMLHQGPLPVITTVRLSRQIAIALAAAHKAGIVHRDLKPANIMVNPQNLVKVLDFGLARPLGSTIGDGRPILPDVTLPGVVMGTAAYLAPEQVKGNPADMQTDLWALGCVIYHMLAGRRAFDSNSVPEILAGILRDEPESLLKINPEVPPSLAAMVEKCLAKKPEHRPRSAKEIASTLRDIGHQLRYGKEGPAKRLLSEEAEGSIYAPRAANLENLNRYLRMISPDYPQIPPARSGPAFIEVNHRGVMVGILVTAKAKTGLDMIAFISPVFGVPAENPAGLYKRLLILSNGHSDVGRFGLDPESGHVNLTSIRICEYLEFREFQYTLDAFRRVITQIAIPLKTEFGLG